MTYHGTNTYLIDSAKGTIVLDPGPDDGAHVETILREAAGKLAGILLTHSHKDHSDAVRTLKQATGLPVKSFGKSADPDIVPDIALEDGDEVDGLLAIHTPGHAADHLCFALPDGTLFTGDHVMSWSSTVVSPPPRGDMAAYFASLLLLLCRKDVLYLPGHGPALQNPGGYVASLLRHRQLRENAIAAIIAEESMAPGDISRVLYSKTDPVLRNAAERNVLSHLIKMENEGRAWQDNGLWRSRKEEVKSQIESTGSDETADDLLPIAKPS
jgi:glyoxylase-like metal-dependent hydrolase (beta-lactamase superfamily II)